MNQKTTEVSISVGSANDGNCITKMSAWTLLPVICKELEMVNWEDDKEKWSHLRDIDFKKPADSEVADLLIGSDYPELHEVLERQTGLPHTPMAERTPLG